MKKYIEENIDKLRAQRDQNDNEGYRFYVAGTYNYIKNAIKESKKEYCNPRNKDVALSLYGDIAQELRIRGFVKDLRKSEYITVIGTGSKRQIRIIKDLDF